MAGLKRHRYRLAVIRAGGRNDPRSGAPGSDVLFGPDVEWANLERIEPLQVYFDDTQTAFEGERPLALAGAPSAERTTPRSAASADAPARRAPRASRSFGPRGRTGAERPHGPSACAFLTRPRRGRGCGATRRDGRAGDSGALDFPLPRSGAAASASAAGGALDSPRAGSRCVPRRRRLLPRLRRRRFRHGVQQHLELTAMAERYIFGRVWRRVRRLLRSLYATIPIVSSGCQRGPDSGGLLAVDDSQGARVPCGRVVCSGCECGRARGLLWLRAVGGCRNTSDRAGRGPAALQGELTSQGHRGLARHVERLARPRHAVVHPDV